MKNKRYWFEKREFKHEDNNKYLIQLQERINQNNIKLNRGDVVGFGDNYRGSDQVYFDGAQLILIDGPEVYAIPREFTFPEFNLDYFLEFGNGYINLSTNQLKFSEIKKCQIKNLFLDLRMNNVLKKLTIDQEIEYVTFVHQNEIFYILNLESFPDFKNDLLSAVLRLSLEGWFIYPVDNDLICVYLALINQPQTWHRNLFFYSY